MKNLGYFSRKVEFSGEYRRYLEDVYMAYELIVQNPTTLEHDARQMRHTVRTRWARFLKENSLEGAYDRSIRAHGGNPSPDVTKRGKRTPA